MYTLIYEPCQTPHVHNDLTRQRSQAGCNGSIVYLGDEEMVTVQDGEHTSHVILILVFPSCEHNHNQEKHAWVPQDILKLMV